MRLEHTRQADPDVYDIVCRELERQQCTVEMIASESTVPLPVLELNGCVFTNKTTEGYPGNRYQAGSHVADSLERLAVERAKAVYGADHANVQVYSGSTANYAVYATVLKPGDLVLGMRLDQGGHLTHGSPVNFLSHVYRFDFYGVSEETEQIDYDSLESMAREKKPKLIIAGASSYPRLIDYARLEAIAQSCGALLMVDMAHIAGLVAAGVIPSPVPHADFVSSSTTKTFCGSRGGLVLCKQQHASALDRGVFPRTISSIHLATMAANAFALKNAGSEAFRTIMQRVVTNAKTLAASLEEYGFRIVSGSTDTHMVLVDLRKKGLTGDIFQNALEHIGITVNKNLIPFDPAKPTRTSGVRIGLTSVSQRGIEQEEIREIASIMNTVAMGHNNPSVLESCKERVRELTLHFPLYPEGEFTA